MAAGIVRTRDGGMCADAGRREVCGRGAAGENLTPNPSPMRRGEPRS